MASGYFCLIARCCCISGVSAKDFDMATNILLWAQGLTCKAQDVEKNVEIVKLFYQGSLGVNFAACEN